MDSSMVVSSSTSKMRQYVGAEIVFASTIYFQMPLQSHFFLNYGKVSLSNKQTKHRCTGFVMLLTCSFFFLQYGGDVTRRMKLLNRQAEGKKKMKLVANIKLPREAFIDVLKR
jgi:hypothetical protein